MRLRLLLLLVVSLFIGSCSDDGPVPAGSSLLVTDGEAEKTYTVEDLEGMEIHQAEFEEVSYLGVKLSALISDAGYDPENVSAVKATAEDGFTVNYDPDLVNKYDTLVAYATVDGPLSEDDGIFRMVLPEQDGKLNPRHLVELRIYQ